VDEGLSFLDTSSVVEVRAHHVLEHVRDLDQVMRELHRVCGGGARLDILVPLANTLWAVANPDHRRLFNHRTFQYYTPEFVTSDAGLFRGFTIVAQTIEREPDEWFDGIQWMVANLHVVLQVVK
jgi:ubiquinone/menaquinone biosynthesis C-methylase UbiE